MSRVADSTMREESRSGQPLPPTTLLICSSGRSAMLTEVVRQVLDADQLPTELLIVENSRGETSPLAALVTDRCNYRYIATTATTLSAKRNIALRAASQDLLVICDDDVCVPRSWFGTLVRASQRAGPGTIVTGRVLAGPEEVTGAFAPSLHPSDVPAIYGRRSTFEDPLATFNCALFRQLYDAVGDFDLRLGPGTPFPACEDNDFGLRTLERGFAIRYEPNALLYHRAWRPQQEFLGLRWRYGVGQGAFYAKHLGVEVFVWRKMLAAWTRHVRRMVPLGRRTTIGELAWFAGFIVGLPRWAVQYRLGEVLRWGRKRKHAS